MPAAVVVEGEGGPVAVGVGRVGAVGVGQPFPVVEGGLGVVDAEPLDLVDQERFLVGEPVGGAVIDDAGQEEGFVD